MKRADLSIFTSFWFITALILLLLNDFLLKPLFHNFLTGKLSDFTGLFVFGLFWITLFPKRKQAVLGIIAIAFTFWKSPLADSFITSWNAHSFFAIARVVDFSDLFGLVMLPLAHYYSINWKNDRQLGINPALPIIVSCFAFSATSYLHKHTVSKSYLLNYSLDSLDKRMDNIETINHGGGASLKDTIEQTTYISFYDTICGLSSDAEITIKILNPNSTLLILNEISHNCPGDESTAEMRIEFFESSVIKPLK